MNTLVIGTWCYYGNALVVIVAVNRQRKQYIIRGAVVDMDALVHRDDLIPEDDAIRCTMMSPVIGDMIRDMISSVFIRVA